MADRSLMRSAYPTAERLLGQAATDMGGKAVEMRMPDTIAASPRNRTET